MLVYFFIWFFRVETGHWKLFLLSLPFVKIIYDFARGVPEKSIIFSGVDPFSLPPDHQLLTIGAGFDGWTPFISTVFSVKALDGKNYNSSIGDYFLIWLNREFGSTIPQLLVFIILIISVVLLAIRFVQYYRFEKNRRADRLISLPLRSLKIGSRIVDIYVSTKFSGSPFTGGIFKPYICLPDDAVQKLNPEELESVIAHELSHVRFYDLIFTVTIQSLGDLFWFVPGYRWLSRKIDRLREIVADNLAISSNTDAHFLASALLKLQEIPDSSKRFILYSAFIREKSLLKERVKRLVGDIKEKPSRFGWQNIWFRFIVTLFISIVVLNSVLGGNFMNEAVMKTPEWFENLFKVSSIFVGHTFYVQS